MIDNADLRKGDEETQLNDSALRGRVTWVTATKVPEPQLCEHREWSGCVIGDDFDKTSSTNLALFLLSRDCTGPAFKLANYHKQGHQSNDTR